jgi:glycosyltransferase involved in cell wall biosynthesis
MKITILSHNLSSNAVMRAHRLAAAAQTFADVTLVGPAEKKGLWPALPSAEWIRTVTERRLPKFYSSMLELVDLADGDILIACKPHLASFGVALMAGELKQKPVILDLDDLDIAFMPRAEWSKQPVMADLKRHGSAVFVSLLTKAAGAAAAITTSSTALRQRFGGTLVPQGCLTELFDPAQIDRERARQELGFTGPTVLFAGTPRWHKGLKLLARAVGRIPGAQLAVVCRASDLSEAYWRDRPLLRLPMVPYTEMPRLLAAADVVAIPQLDTEASRYQMPIKVFDAMAAGKPIVASSLSDLPMVLEGCAEIVPPGVTKPLTKAVKKLIEQSDEAQALGRRARARCLQEYSMQQVGKILRGVVEGVLAKDAG